MMKHYLYVFTDEGKVLEYGKVCISKGQWVLDTDTPIEDYGSYLLTPEPTSTPYEDWVKGW